jgi:hypothetical protein
MVSDRDSVIEAMADYLLLKEQEARLALKRAREIRATYLGIPEVKIFELFILRIRRVALKRPRLLASAAQQKKYVERISLLEKEGDDLRNSVRDARSALANVDEMLADLSRYVEKKIAQKHPELVRKISPFLANDGVVEEAISRNRLRAANQAARDWS